MDDGGISLTGLTIGGAALTAIGGVLGSWYKAKYGRTEIHPQPLTIKEEKGPVPRELDDERHRTLNGQMIELFNRLIVAEKTLARMEAVEDQVKSIDGKVDIIIRKLGVRTK